MALLSLAISTRSRNPKSLLTTAYASLEFHLISKIAFPAPRFHLVSTLLSTILCSASTTFVAATPPKIAVSSLKLKAAKTALLHFDPPLFLAVRFVLLPRTPPTTKPASRILRISSTRPRSSARRSASASSPPAGCPASERSTATSATTTARTTERSERQYSATCSAEGRRRHSTGSSERKWGTGPCWRSSTGKTSRWSRGTTGR